MNFFDFRFCIIEIVSTNSFVDKDFEIFFFIVWSKWRML